MFFSGSWPEDPKPTVGLDYAYARNTSKTSSSDSVAHLYELGAGTSFVNLIDVPLSPKYLCSSIFVIVIDLSKVFILGYLIFLIIIFNY
jgi:dynein light intermediate chain 2